MSLEDVSASVTGCSNVIGLTTEESYSQLVATAEVECETTTLELGDTATVAINGTNVMVGGIVKKISKVRPPGIWRINLHDVLVKAVDYFMVASDPKSPFQRNNISSLSLITALLAEAGITNVTTVEPGPAVFTWGTNEDGAQFNLQSVSDAVQFIANITGNLIWADDTGQVQFAARKPYVDGDASVGNIDGGVDIIEGEWSKDTDRTRNVVQVYGKTPLSARASASNPYLIVDQAICVSHPLLDTQAICDGTASVNLTLLNRLNEAYNLTLRGDPTKRARQVWTLDDVFLEASARKIFLYRVSHQVGENGYTTQVLGIP